MLHSFRPVLIYEATSKDFVLSCFQSFSTGYSNANAAPKAGPGQFARMQKRDPDNSAAVAPCTTVQPYIGGSPPDPAWQGHPHSKDQTRKASGSKARASNAAKPPASAAAAASSSSAFSA